MRPVDSDFGNRCYYSQVGGTFCCLRGFGRLNWYGDSRPHIRSGRQLPEHCFKVLGSCCSVWTSLTRRQAAELVAASPACWRMNQMADPADLDFAEFVSSWIAKDLVDVDWHASAV